MTHDPWKEAADQGSGIQGAHLKKVKEKWTLNDEPVETGPKGIKVCVLMSTAEHGMLKWVDRVPAEKQTQRYEDVAPSQEDLPEGYDPYTQFLCVGADEAHLGQLMTFTSSAWSARGAFRALIGPYRLTGKRKFPICTLRSKLRKNDPNGNYDPVFSIIDWAPRSDFTGMLGEDTGEALELPKPSVAEAPPTAPELPIVRGRMTVTSGPAPDEAPPRPPLSAYEGDDDGINF